MSVLIQDCCNSCCSCNSGNNSSVPSIYVAKISQTLLENPVVKTLYNSYGFNIVWTYSAVGVYHATFPVAIDPDKLVCSLFPNINGSVFLDVDNDITATLNITSPVVELSVFDTGVLTDGLLTDLVIEFTSY